MPKFIDPHVHFVGSQRHLDTVVFVHGILFGHYKKTWKRFAKLLPGDPDLPRLDLMLWGYDTGVIKGRSIDLNGERLTTDLRVRVNRPDSSIALVGHSLGGLVILRALTTQMKRKLAETAPCVQVKQIITFGTPLNGHWVGRVARSFFLFKLLLNQQARDLCRETFCRELISDVEKHIFSPELDGPQSRRIPIRLNIGNQDKVVTVNDRSAALAQFADPPPNEFDGTHSSIKDPETRHDLRYRVLQNDLQLMVSETFRRLSRALQEASNDYEKDVIRSEIYERYWHIAEKRAKVYARQSGQKEIAERAIELATLDALKRDLPPFLHIEHAFRAINIVETK